MADDLSGEAIRVRWFTDRAPFGDYVSEGCSLYLSRAL